VHNSYHRLLKARQMRTQPHVVAGDRGCHAQDWNPSHVMAVATKESNEATKLLAVGGFRQRGPCNLV